MGCARASGKRPTARPHSHSRPPRPSPYSSQTKGHDYTVVHLGKLQAGAGPATGAGASAAPAVQVAPGDNFDNPCTVPAAAACLARVLRGCHPEVRNATFSLATEGGRGATGPVPAAVWDDELLKCRGPELLRLPVSGPGDPASVQKRAAQWLREFARSWLKKGAGLPTRVTVEEMPDGAKLVFLKSGYEYSKGWDDDEDKGKGDQQDGKKGGDEARDRRAAQAPGKGQPDGALELLADAAPVPRVRVRRADMEGGATVKATSEAQILARLQKELPKSFTV
mmetsp:Transcript_4662/g.15448  ORF Transcript_4662/g.15448 Transcript_4662/m.15448 type:complete len:281 (+) Transcript_4662:93-935(+)